MRYERAFLFLIGFVILFISIISTSTTTHGSTILLEDDFTGANGSPPNTTKWFVQTWDSNDYVSIEGNTVRTHSIDGVYSRFWTKDAFNTTNFTLNVDMQPRSLSGRILEICVRTKVGDVFDEMVTLTYLMTNGWEYHYRFQGDMVTVTTNVNTLVADEWYTLNFTYSMDEFQAVVIDRGTHQQIWDSGIVTTDPLNEENVIHMGVASWVLGDPSANWDNFRLIDNNEMSILNLPPKWKELPTFNAVEDVIFNFNFTDYISDEDTEKDKLTLEAISPFIISQDHLTFSFLFRDEFDKVSIPMFLSDGINTIRKDLFFNIQPTNDPPIYWGPNEFVIVEDIPRTIDFLPLVTDEDNLTSDLYLKGDNPYVVIDRLLVTITVPDGITVLNLSLEVSDAIADVPFQLLFNVIPVNDPPYVLLGDELNVTEDDEFILYLAGSIGDIDSPSDNLRLDVRNANISVDGFAIHFYYKDEVPDHIISIRLTDGELWVEKDVKVHVNPSNDPPVLHSIAPILIQEDTIRILNIDAYLFDSDTPIQDIQISSNSPNCTVIGHDLHFYYRNGGFSREITIQAFDGEFSVDIGLVIIVEEKNDAPIIHQMPHSTFIKDIPDSINFTLYIEDEETSVSNLSLTCDSPFVINQNGLIITFIFNGRLSERTVYFNVSDGQTSTEGSIQIIILSITPPLHEKEPVVDYIQLIGFITIALTIILASSVEISKVSLLSLFLPLYLRLKKDEILDQFTRGRIYEFISANPGEHYNSIKKALDLPNGSLTYHLQILEEEDHIKSQRDGIYKRFYPVDMRIPKQDKILNNSQILILETIKETPGISQKDIASILGVSSSTINYHVEKLIDRGFILKVRNGMRLRYYILDQPDA